jgi:hypothetical protein
MSIFQYIPHWMHLMTKDMIKKVRRRKPVKLEGQDWTRVMSLGIPGLVLVLLCLKRIDPLVMELNDQLLNAF